MAFSFFRVGGHTQHFEEGERFPLFGCGSAALWYPDGSYRPVSPEASDGDRPR